MLKNLLIDILVLLLSLASNYCFGQTAALPNIIPPSPETAALFSFLDYPVNLSTGQIQIDIPLYELKCGRLTVPISISYNPRGRRVFDQTGPAGLGWTLNAGGEIARTVYGKPDDQFFFPNTLQSADILSNKDDYDYLASICENDNMIGNYDSEYDVFSYYFADKSGKFIVDENYGAVTVYSLPLKPYKFEEARFPSYIIDDKGNSYYFDQLERCLSSNELGQPITGKLLTSIVSADKKDTVNFIYQPFHKISKKPTQDYVLTDNISSGDGTPITEVKDNDNTYHYYIQRLVKIKYKNTQVEFNLDGTSDRIKSITISTDGEVIRKILLQMSIIDTPVNSNAESTYTLDRLIFQDQNGSSDHQYSFEYNSSFNFSTDNRDFYGFLNGTSQVNLVPTYENVHVYAGSGGSSYNYYTDVGTDANRSPSGNYMKDGVLKKITYPTGGSAEFTYEVNLCKRLDQVFEGGGLRISQIKYIDDNGNVKFKTYKYGKNEDGYGSLALDHIIMPYRSYETRYFTDIYPDNPSSSSTGGYRKRDYSSEILPGISGLANEPVYYEFVTEYEGTPTNNIGKKVYQYEWNQYNSTYKYTLANFDLPVFPGIIHGIDFSELPIDAALIRPYIRKYDLWNSDDLITIYIYKNNGDNTYSKVKTISNQYGNTITKVLKGFHIFKYLQISNDIGTYIHDLERGAAEFYELPIFLFADYDMDIGKKELKSRVETYYSDSGIVLNETKYFYNDDLLISKIQTTFSDGSQNTVYYKYPLDYTLSDDPSNQVAKGIRSLQNIHSISQMVEKYVQKSDPDGNNSRTVSAVLNTYKPSDPWLDIAYEWEPSGSSGTFSPTAITNSIVTKDAGYRPEISFDDYDINGNILQQHKVNDANHSYIWDYNNTYPIAETVNAAQAEIAYTSFESDGKGNWSFSGLPSTDQTAPTGKKVYSLSTGSITKTITNTDKSYLVSYWSRTGAATITASISMKQGLSRDGWTYYEHVIPAGTTTVAISGSAVIDELRLYPSDAQMTTYTYEPLIGITSQCSADNGIQYYEYDGMGRLKDIRDIDHNIIKTFKYHYKQ